MGLIRITQVALLLAAAGAVAIMVGLLGDLARLIGLGAIVLGAVLAAPAGRTAGWWSMLAAGALLCGAGLLIGLATTAVGGLIALLGGVLVLLGATLGFPLSR